MFCESPFMVALCVEISGQLSAYNVAVTQTGKDSLYTKTESSLSIVWQSAGNDYEAIHLHAARAPRATSCAWSFCTNTLSRESRKRDAIQSLDDVVEMRGCQRSKTEIVKIAKLSG